MVLEVYRASPPLSTLPLFPDLAGADTSLPRAVNVRAVRILDVADTDDAKFVLISMRIANASACLTFLKVTGARVIGRSGGT